jgi:hypothetical protein
MSDSYISFSCPVCNKQYRTPSKNAGQKRTCTDCSNVHTIPSVSEQQQAKSKLIDCPDCGTSISSKAFYCTKCGLPSLEVAQRAKTQGCAMMLLIYVLCGLLLNEIAKWVILSRLNNR